MRILQSAESAALLAYFPRTRLSYEVNIHKKDETYNEQCFIIPKGRKCVAWATEWNRQKIIAMIEIAPLTNNGMQRGRQPSHQHQHQHQQPQRSDNPFQNFSQENGWTPGQVSIYDVCFNGSLSYGTVFSGTMFKTMKANTHQQIPCFCIQNVYWYKGNPVSTIRFTDYVKLCEQLFVERDIVQVSYTSSGLIFGVPVMCNNEDEAVETITTLPYQVYSIHFRSDNNVQDKPPRIHQKVMMQTNRDSQYNVYVAATSVATSGLTSAATTTATATARQAPTVPVIVPVSRMPRIQFIKPADEMLTNIQAVFIVRPNVQNDIYELFVKTARSTAACVFHNFAHIPNYKTSVMMNALFRKIKENVRLDTMEESDNDDEFESTEPDKFVSLKTEYKMVCRLNKKFCRWVPISIVCGTNSNGNGNAPHQDIITELQVKQHEVRYLPKKYVNSNARR
jgi:aerobic-type carbon monoxide dehydrogenase small subunit (CoxS/CutS family)